MNYRHLLIVFILLFASSFLQAQSPWASSVVDYSFGNGQTLGQSAPDFPANVLGAVNPSVSNTVPASVPSEVLSLGRNGWIILSFEQDIINGEGADFTVFENAFEYAEGEIFDEWLMVSVSEDGITWFSFPYDSLTGEGMAGRTPTFGGVNINYQDITQSGGDGFDLEVVGLSKARYVKLKDATRFQTPEKISAEVDAVIAIHTVGNTMDLTPEAFPLTCNIFGNILYLSTEEAIQFEIMDCSGKCLFSIFVSPGKPLEIPVSEFSQGVYFLRGYNAQKQFTRKWMKA